MRRSTVIMLAVLALVAGIYWYMQQPDNAVKKAFNEEPTATPIAEMVIRPEQGPISGIKIERSADGKSIQLDKNAGSWVISSDNNLPADPSAAESAVSNALALRILTRLDTPPPASSTGLDNPAYTLTFGLPNSLSISIKMGKKTVADTGYYTELPGGAVVVVYGSALDALTGLVDNPPYQATPAPAASATP